MQASGITSSTLERSRSSGGSSISVTQPHLWLARSDIISTFTYSPVPRHGSRYLHSPLRSYTLGVPETTES